MICVINNEEIEMGQVTYRDMGFGEKVANYAEIGYDLEMSLEEFSKIMENEFNIYVGECKEDDEKFGDIDAISDMGYKTFKELLECNRNLLGELIKEFMIGEFLRNCFLHTQEKKIKYIINTIEQIIILDNKVVVRGSSLDCKLVDRSPFLLP